MLSTPILADKIRLSQEAVTLWNSRKLDLGIPPTAAAAATTTTQQPAASHLQTKARDHGWQVPSLPDHPARPVKPRLVEPREIQSPKRTAKAHGLTLSQVLLHNVAHIELTAVDMYWDTLVRFAPSDPSLVGSPATQQEFCHDFLQVISDEARHLHGTLGRLHALGIDYGRLDCHKSLWDIGVATKDDLAARLALVPLVQEARGLDAGPRFVEQLSGANDHESMRLMQMIYEEEIRHVATGMKWFKHVAAFLNQPDLDLFFQTIVRKRMRSPLLSASRPLPFHPLTNSTNTNKQIEVPTGLIPPFNEMARAAAGMGLNMYKPLASATLPHQPRLTQPEQKRGYVTSAASRGNQVSTSPACLFVSSQWPETKATAAGVRTMHLMEMFQSHGFRVSFASMARFFFLSFFSRCLFGVSGIHPFPSLSLHYQKRGDTKSL